MNNLNAFRILLSILPIRVMNMAKSATRLFPVYRALSASIGLRCALHYRILGYCLEIFNLH